MVGDDFLNANAPFEERVRRINEIIKECNRIVFFGGAGVSTASGIPDFRGPNGLYNNVDKEFAAYQPEYLLSSECFNHNPKVFYKFYKKCMDARNYEPNVIHKKLAQLEQNGKMLGIVTQNIDMLHEKAGSQNVYKIHGTIGKNHCIKCHKEYGIDRIFEDTNPIPRCDCGRQNNFIRPDVTLYGEKLPSDAMAKALDALQNADCLIVCGTSLQVNPAANMVSQFYGKYMAILNRDETQYDSYADVVCHEDIFEVFEKIEV